MQLRTAAWRKQPADPWTVVLWLLAGAVVIWGVMSLIGLLLTHIVDRGCRPARCQVHRGIVALRAGLCRAVQGLSRHALPKRRAGRRAAGGLVAIVGGQHVLSGPLVAG